MRTKGFTLIELIIVIVLLAIISTFTFRFVGIGAEMYATGASRLQLLEQSRFAIERITRELRNSVPNSARVINSDQCLEFVPVKAAGTYYKAPFSSNSPEPLSLEFFSFSEQWGIVFDDETDPEPPFPSKYTDQYDRLFIYATQSHYIYSNGSPPQRWVKVSKDIDRDGSLTNIELDGYFAEESPTERLYIGKPPVRFCVEGTELKRYSNYGWESAPSPNNGTVISEQLVGLTGSSEAPFRVNNAELMRNNVILIFLEYQSSRAERLFFNREVHIPNAP